MIVDDANLEPAAFSCAMGVLFNPGQVCAARTRILVQRGIAKDATARAGGETQAGIGWLVQPKTFSDAINSMSMA